MAADDYDSRQRTPSGQPLSIQLYSLDIQYDFDNVRLDATAVPTPTAAFGGSALIGVLLAWRRLRSRGFIPR